jgi:hypothetical protein
MTFIGHKLQGVFLRLFRGLKMSVVVFCFCNGNLATGLFSVGCVRFSLVV